MYFILPKLSNFSSSKHGPGIQRKEREEFIIQERQTTETEQKGFKIENEKNENCEPSQACKETKAVGEHDGMETLTISSPFSILYTLSISHRVYTGNNQSDYQ